MLPQAKKRMARLGITLLCCCVISLFTTGAYALQTSKMSPNCPTGGKEAEELHLLGRKYRKGAKGMPRDKARAEKLFEQALDMGNARPPAVAENSMTHTGNSPSDCRYAAPPRD